MSLQRVVLLEAWKEFEKFHGTAEELAKVEAMMPRVVKKWRKLEDGSGALEECKSNSHTPALVQLTVVGLSRID